MSMYVSWDSDVIHKCVHQIYTADNMVIERDDRQRLSEGSAVNRSNFKPSISRLYMTDSAQKYMHEQVFKGCSGARGPQNRLKELPLRRVLKSKSRLDVMCVEAAVSSTCL